MERRADDQPARGAVGGGPAVYYRRPGLPVLSPRIGDPYRRWALSQAVVGMVQILSSLSVVWMHHPDVYRASAHKLGQLVAATTAGLCVPRSFVGNSLTHAQRWGEGIGRPLVCKPIAAASLSVPDGPPTMLPTRRTVEVDPELARLAKARLAECGYAPTVVTGDARLGFPGSPGLDRLIVTCGFDAFPYALAGSVRPGGVVVCPLGWGNARLTMGRNGTLEGHFLAGGSYFMRVREEGGTGAVPCPGAPQSISERAAVLDPGQLAGEGFRFVQSLVLSGAGEGSELDDEGRVPGHRVWSRDGAWAQVEGGVVRQGGPRHHWKKEGA